ncbi:MAG: hypothetical protein ACLPX5_16450 [Dissulfurispiraceae bacterium]
MPLRSSDVSYILGGPNDALSTALTTIKHARMLDTDFAQFTILTPYQETALYKKTGRTLRHKKWHLFDRAHLVFRHKHIPFVLMKLLLIQAFTSFYARGLRSIRHFFKACTDNAPFLIKVFRKAH